jgi:hypothetical protein
LAVGGAGIFTDAGKWLAAAWALSLARVRASANGLDAWLSPALL